MKKLLLILLFIISVKAAKAISFVDTTKIWTVAEYSFGGNVFTTFYKFEGDTTFGAIAYKKLMLSMDSMNAWYYFRALREDQSGKVYIYDQGGSIDRPYYDFSLNTGDTLHQPVQDICYPEMIVDSIDQITLLNGEIRKRMYMGGTYPEIWIEGFGSSSGPGYVALFSCTTDMLAELNCVFENDTLKFHNPTYPTCYVSFVGIEETSPFSNWTLAPNPFSDFSKLTLKSDNKRPKNLRIFDMHGRMVIEQLKLSSNEITIEKKQLTAGIYLFKVSDDRGIVSQGKLVVE